MLTIRNSLRNILLASAFILTLSLFCIPVRASQLQTDSMIDPEIEEIKNVAEFESLAADVRAIYINRSDALTEEELTERMPKTLSVILDNGERVEAVVTWFAAGDDFDITKGYYYQFSPRLDEGYSLPDGFDMVASGPYIGVFISDESVSISHKDLYASNSDENETIVSREFFSYSSNDNEERIYRYLISELGMNSAAVLAAIIGTVILRGPFNRTGQALDEEIGAFEFAPREISLAKDPDTPRHLRFSGAMLEYFPGDTFTREDFNADRTTDLGFAIFPAGMAVWGTNEMLDKDGENVFVVWFLPPHILYDNAAIEKQPVLILLDSISARQPELLTGPEFAKKLKGMTLAHASEGPGTAGTGEVAENGETAGTGKVAENGDTAGTGEVAENGETAGTGEKADRPIRITGSQIVISALDMITAILLLATFFRNFAGIGLIILLVSLIQYLRASTLPKGIAYRNVLTIMIYSTFPAQIAATLLDAAGLESFVPILSFSLLFVCIFFVYQIFAFRAVMKKVCPQNGRKDDDFDDSDF